MVKAQYRLAIIDKAGRQLGPVTPKYPPNLDTATIRAKILRTGELRALVGVEDPQGDFERIQETANCAR